MGNRKDAVFCFPYINFQRIGIRLQGVADKFKELSGVPSQPECAVMSTKFLSPPKVIHMGKDPYGANSQVRESCTLFSFPMVS